MGNWLPEPVVVPAGEPGPAEHAELADSLSMAFLVLLEALSPAERAVFMLREAFGYGYPDVAAITGKTEVNCRQIFARARQRIAAGGQARGSAPSPARRAEGEELARRFFQTADGGDMDALLGMLAPDVVFHGDGGGKAQAIGTPLHGREPVARFLAGLFRRSRFLGASLRLAWVNGQPGAVGYDAEGRVLAVFGLELADGVVQAIRVVVNPDKLSHIGPVSDAARLPEKELPPGYRSMRHERNCLPAVGGLRGAGAMHVNGSPDGLGYGRGGEAEVPPDITARTRRAERAHGDDRPAHAGPALPAHGRCLFHGHPRQDVRWQYQVTVGLVLLLEQRP